MIKINSIPLFLFTISCASTTKVPQYTTPLGVECLAIAHTPTITYAAAIINGSKYIEEHRLNLRSGTVAQILLAAMENSTNRNVSVNTAPFQRCIKANLELIRISRQKPSTSAAEFSVTASNSVFFTALACLGSAVSNSLSVIFSKKK